MNTTSTQHSKARVKYAWFARTNEIDRRIAEEGFSRAAFFKRQRGVRMVSGRQYERMLQGQPTTKASLELIAKKLKTTVDRIGELRSCVDGESRPVEQLQSIGAGLKIEIPDGGFESFQDAITWFLNEINRLGICLPSLIRVRAGSIVVEIWFSSAQDLSKTVNAIKDSATSGIMLLANSKWSVFDRELLSWVPIENTESSSSLAPVDQRVHVSPASTLFTGPIDAASVTTRTDKRARRRIDNDSNVICGNKVSGITFKGDATTQFEAGNLIGISADGTIIESPADSVEQTDEMTDKPQPKENAD